MAVMQAADSGQADAAGSRRGYVLGGPPRWRLPKLSMDAIGVVVVHADDDGWFRQRQ
jgi:hypothetical protein